MMNAWGDTVRRARRGLIFGCFACATLTTGLGLERADLRVVGSDLLGLDFSKSLYAFAGSRGVQLALALDGSRPGLAALKSHRADLAIVVLPPDELGELAGFQVITLGYHHIVVLAPAKAPVEQISLVQLAAVFGREGRASGARWGDLRVGGEWAAVPIAPVAPDVGTGIAVELFRHVVLQGAPLRATVQRFLTGDELVRQFAGESRALAIAAQAPGERKDIKVLPIVFGPTDSAVSPTAENLHAGRYPLRLPVQLVFRPERSAKIAGVVRHVLSEEFAVVLERAGVAQVPPAARTEMLRRFTQD